MTIYERDAWDQAGDMDNGIIGAHLKCSKGHWSLDDRDIDNAGLRICVIMPSAVTGQVLWQDRKIAERDIGRIHDGYAPPREIRLGWNPYTSFLCVRADEKALGELLTFTSSSWGGRNAFQKLVNPYRLKQRRQFPICELATRERGDENRNVDPLFKIVGWSDCGNFADLLPPPDKEPQAIEFRPAVEQQRTAELIDDDIPF
jgi:hypothetical protein